MFRLDGMNALVTGASGGIGSAIATALASQGARVALSGSNGDKLRAFREQLIDEVGSPEAGDHVEITCNLSDTTQVEELIPATLDTLGGIDIVINNAGITRDNLAMRMKDNEWDQVVSINLEAAFRIMRASARPMMKARFGRIINITSVVGHTGNPGQMNYCAAKAGLTGMTKSFAQEVASRGITANCLAPGFIRTAMTTALDEKQTATINARIPMGKMGEGADIGAAATFLASPGGRLCHRRDDPREWWYGDGVSLTNADLGC